MPFHSRHSFQQCRSSLKLRYPNTYDQYAVDKNDITATLKLSYVDATDAAKKSGPILHLQSTTNVKNMHGDWADNYRRNDGTCTEKLPVVFRQDALDHRAETHSISHLVVQMTRRNPDGTSVDWEDTRDNDRTIKNRNLMMLKPTR